MSPLTVRSYGDDLLRWWRLLRVAEVIWDHATRVRERNTLTADEAERLEPKHVTASTDDWGLFT